MSERLRVAAAQLVSVPGDVATNVASAVRAVEQAAADDARLLVLPELFLTGYVMPPPIVEPDDSALVPLDDAATAAGLLVLAGAAVPTPEGRRLSLLSFGGGVRRVYDKQHLVEGEQPHFVPGDHGVALDVDGWPVGLSVCYDGSFPEHARAAAQAGALLYVNAMAFFAGSEHRRDLYYRSRALDNGMYVLTAGLVGRCGDAEFNGGAAVHDPEGRTIVSAPAGSEAVVVAELDRRVVESTRAAHPMLADVRDLGDVVRLAAG
ncbi:carbon-nitrogen hydrolase family protein [Aeromicrobium massiliense]|uniref:carbon-nitrogen hydrolase family protein n=1 Tax=Aeromicrobium massiliense TaxID=1464554 RepID=UPI0002E2B2FF|nr:carbon-nitrogen hydrolase family protein [Aeromicrobium massiliense]